ncbi:ATP-binding protein [Qipengyuania sp. MTN3-11]|uniref:ATP-binding protein n=1 Tax=Qipengyuania sp. MTN3-11 TaxID=3056557 RepID=UPI0036F424C0
MDNCADEPIHIPGRVQSRGMLLVADEAGCLTHLCARARERWDGSTRTLRDMLGEEAEDAVRVERIHPRASHFFQHGVAVSIPKLGLSLAVASAHQFAGRQLVEIEPIEAATVEPETARWLNQILGEDLQARDVRALLHSVCKRVRDLSGYDRVMAYRFDSDWNGEVIAEAQGELVSSYLGLHFPSTDIPHQARELYRRQLTRCIDDVEGQPVPLEAIDPDDTAPVDLSFCDIRAVSPIHIKYLQNMGVTASLTVSIVIDDALWGLLVCHHYAGPRKPLPKIRSAIQTACYLVGTRIKTIERAHEQAMVALVNDCAIAMRESMGSGEGEDEDGNENETFAARMAAAFAPLAENWECAALIVRTPEDTVRWGARAGTGSAMPYHGPPIVSDRFDPGPQRDLGVSEEIVGGALVPLDDDGAYIFFGREEALKTIDWAGERDKVEVVTENGRTRLSPRKSFELWQEEHRACSRSWSVAEKRALERLGGTLRYLYADHRRAIANRKLAAMERLSALGQLTGGVAHDINNILAILVANLERLEDAELSDEHRRGINAMFSATDQAVTLSNQLLSFARRQALDPKPFDIADVLGGFGNLIERVLPSHISYRSQVATDLPWVLADRARLESVLVNLVMNACDALQDQQAGEIVMTAAPAKLTDWIARKRGIPPGDYVELVVRDNGPGIEEKIRERVFDPFFTTKGAGQGHGLGLSTAYGFMKQTGGHIEVEDSTRTGAAIRLILPIAPPASITADDAHHDVFEKGAEDHVLIVEDDASVAEALANQVHRLGMGPELADTARAALQLLRKTRPDILMTDINMPGSNGIALAIEARALYPDLPVLFVTGQPQDDEAIPLDPMMKETTEVLRKPFRRTALAKALNRTRAKIGGKSNR